MVRCVHLSCLPQLRGQPEQPPGDFVISRMVGVAALNSQHLVYWPYNVAWDPITLRLLFLFRNPTAPPPRRLQATRTLNDILAIALRHLMAITSNLQATVA
jgi:hypothetical protein